MNAAAENGVRILPVDSEHCAVFQCINDSRNGKNSIKNVILTAFRRTVQRIHRRKACGGYKGAGAQSSYMENGSENHN